MPKPPESFVPSCKSTAQRSAWHHQNSEDVHFQSRPGTGVRGKKCVTVPTDGLEASSDGGCQAWLMAWEARQERLLRRHEEDMRMQVESLRRELVHCNALHERGMGQRMDSIASNMLLPCRESLRWGSDPCPSDGETLTSGLTSGEAVILECETGKSTSHVAKRRTRMELERPQSRMRSLVFSLVHCRGFSVATSSMIFLYTLAVGVMAELEMSSALKGEPEPWWLWHVDCGFAASFVLEVLLRLLSDGKGYLVGVERKWNIFDACVAAVGVADVGLGVHMNLGFFRILRACRVVRVLRVIKNFSALRDLRLMVESLCACVPCLGWGLVLLGFLKYIFAVVLLRGTHQFVRDGSLSADSQVLVRESFSGMVGALLSLTQAISGGRSWGEFLRPFEEVSPVYSLLFPAFMLFVIFGALNILTGIFVESTSSIAKQNRELAVEEEIARTHGAENQIREFFEDLDADGSGTLSMDELSAALQDPRLKAYFSVLQIHAEDTRRLFQLLDERKTGAVEIEDFIEQCQKLRGGARAMDVAAVLKESGKMHKEFKVLMKSVNDMSSRMRRQASPNPLKMRSKQGGVKTLSDIWASEKDGESRKASKRSSQS